MTTETVTTPPVETPAPETTTPPAEASQLDRMVDQVSEGLFGPEDTDIAPVQQAKQESAPAEAKDVPPQQHEAKKTEAEAEQNEEEIAAAALEAIEAPKAWPQEMHEHWKKLDRNVQEYLTTREHQMVEGLSQYKGNAEIGQRMMKVLNPFMPALNQSGQAPERTVEMLMNAHWQLTQGTPESRRMAYELLGQQLGFGKPRETANNGGEPNAEMKRDPEVDRLSGKISQLEERQRATDTAEQQRRIEKAGQDIDKFSADKEHYPYFDEVLDDIADLLERRVVGTLQEAYDTAIVRNPVIRAKEVARLEKEAIDRHTKSLKDEADKKKRASSVNLQGKETAKTPTEPEADETMEDTIRNTYRKMNSGG